MQHQINSFYYIILYIESFRLLNWCCRIEVDLENDAEVGVLVRGSHSQEFSEVKNTMMIQVRTEQ